MIKIKINLTENNLVSCSSSEIGGCGYRLID